MAVARAGADADPLVESSPMRIGDRVRVKNGDWAGGRLVIGELIAIDDKGVQIKREHHVMPLPVAWDDIDRLDVSRGWNFRPGIVGAGVGGLVFALGGAYTSGLANLDCEHRCRSGADHLKAAAVVGTVGVGLGGIIGSMFADDRWERARTRVPAAALAVVPQHGGGARVALTLRF